MIIRIKNWVTTPPDFWPSFSFIMYMVIYAMLFLTVFKANSHLHSTNDEYFNKYIRAQYAAWNCQLHLKVFQCLLGVWAINYTVFLITLATFLFRCIPSGFYLLSDIILENAILLLWAITLEYRIKIDTNAPKKYYKSALCKLQKMGIRSKFRMLFKKTRDLPSSAISIITKKSVGSEVASVTSSLPSYKTQKLPTYSVNQEPPSIAPRYEESSVNAGSTEVNLESMNVVEGSSSNRNNTQQYETILREYTFLFMLFSVEYKVAIPE